MKKKYYSVQSSSDDFLDYISFHKNDNNKIVINMEYAELEFTVKEAREIIEKLKKCILD